MLDPQVAALGQRRWVSVEAYPDPVHIVNAPLYQFGTTHKIVEPGLRNVAQITYSVPSYTYKANQNLPVSAAKLNNLGLLNGAAPSTGIYTGIPSGCHNGAGGNLY